MQTFDILILTIDSAAKVKIKNKMTKEILHKILKEGTSLDINAIPVEEKKAMQTFLWILFFNFYILPSIFFKMDFRNGKLLILKIAKINFSFV